MAFKDPRQAMRRHPAFADYDWAKNTCNRTPPTVAHMSEPKLIGLDGRAFYGTAAGTGRYVTELCKALDVALPEARFYVYGNKPLHMPVSSPRWQWRAEPSRCWRSMPASAWFFLRSGQLASHDNLDVFWGCANFLPLNLPSRIKTVLTVYDLVFKLFPQTMGIKHRLAYQLFFRRALHSADRRVTISQGTATRLMQHFGAPTDAVVRPAVRPQFHTPPPQLVEQTRAHFGLPCRYFLSVSTLEPRKNLTAVLQAMVNLVHTGITAAPCLVLVGQRGWRNQALESMLDKSRQAGVQVIELGYVPDADLPALYAGAQAVLMPSLYEGFGMPILEALQCGARVLTSDTPETREAGGRHAIYVEPTVTGIQTGLQTLLNAPTTNTVAPSPAPDWSWSSGGLTLAQLIRSLW